MRPYSARAFTNSNSFYIFKMKLLVLFKKIVELQPYCVTKTYKRRILENSIASIVDIYT